MCPMRVMYPHMGWCSVVQVHGNLRARRWDLANRRGGARGGRGENSRLVVELAGSIVTWPSRDQLSLGGGGRGQRRRQVGMVDMA